MIHAVILGIVEGVTEFLPISSTGHLILTSRLLGISQTGFWKSFEIAIQLGAILAIVFLYWKVMAKNIAVLKKICIAFLPTACIGLALYKVIKTYLFSEIVVVFALFIGGIVLIVFELFHKEKKTSESEIQEISYKKSFLIGIFQSCAVIPGVSRAAATIIGGLALGIKRRTIVEFSFLLAIPTMLAATTLDLLKSAPHFTLAEFEILAVGFIVSFFVALISVKWLLHYIQKNNFILFGVYRILIALLFFVFIIRL